MADGVGAGHGARAELRRATIACSAIDVALGVELSKAARMLARRSSTPSWPAASSWSTDGHDARGAGARGEQRLRRVEHVRRRDADAVGLQPPHGAERLLDERELDDDLVGDLRELLAVAIRARWRRWSGRREDGTVHEAAQLGEVRARRRRRRRRRAARAR